MSETTPKSLSDSLSTLHQDIVQLQREEQEQQQKIPDISLLISDNDEDPYVTVLIVNGELEDITISDNALVDFDAAELTIVINGVILAAFNSYIEAVYDYAESNGLTKS